jgi:hypothetical protein
VCLLLEYCTSLWILFLIKTSWSGGPALTLTIPTFAFYCWILKVKLKRELESAIEKSSEQMTVQPVEQKMFHMLQPYLVDSVDQYYLCRYSRYFRFSCVNCEAEPTWIFPSRSVRTSWKKTCIRDSVDADWRIQIL